VNAFDSDCAVVTSVDIDHTDYLGDTRAEIAIEKAGIFRKNKPAIFGSRDMPENIALEAQRIGATLWRLGAQFDYTASASQWNFRSDGGVRLALPLPALRGAYQLENASAALAVLDAVQARLPVSGDAVRRGLAEARLSGRFQILLRHPQIILDVAHNPHAARALAGNLAELPSARTVAVFAMLHDKDIVGVAKILREQINVWRVAGLDMPRGATAAEIAAALRQAGVPDDAIQTFDTVADALRHASKEAGDDDRIVTFGSFHTVAEAMRELNPVYEA
jgi:dihydrofolate synthase/folylpolyglutamate synthase